MTSERAKAYTWLLTVIIGLAVTTGVRQFSEFLIAAPTKPLLPVAVRFAIFLILAIRWTLGSLWYFDKYYISNTNVTGLSKPFFWDLFVSFFNFLAFVPLALTITTPGDDSVVAKWLNTHIAGGKQVSFFLWILGFLLAYDSIWLLIRKLGLKRIRGTSTMRIHWLWTILNLITLLFCCCILFWYGWQGKPLERAEIFIGFVLVIAAMFDLNVTVLENSEFNQWLSEDLESKPK
jgi:hypothetical protein